MATFPFWFLLAIIGVIVAVFLHLPAGIALLVLALVVAIAQNSGRLRL